MVTNSKRAKSSRRRRKYLPDPIARPPEEDPVTARLIAQSPGKVEVFPLRVNPVSLGREPTNDLVLAGRDVSRRHCLVEAHPEGGHRVRDLSSTNGVVLNDRRITEARLRPFDRLRLGEVSIVYLDPATDANRVQALLTPHDAADTDAFGPDQLRGPPSRDRLLFLLLTIQELRQEGEPGPLLDLVLTELQACTGADRVALVLEQARTGQPRLVAARGGLPLNASQAAELPVVRRALAGGGVLLGETPLDPATIVVPVVSPRWEARERRRGGAPTVRGVLLLGQHGRASLTTEEGQLLHGIGRQLAIVFAGARLQRQAGTDLLTRLSTRASLEGIFQAELRGAAQAGSSLGVIMLDVDDFKSVNDTLGHAAGDTALQAVGRLLQSSLRSEDSAGRWGGEEFLVLLPGADLAGARAAAEKIVRSVGALTIEGLPRLTVSAGVAVSPVHGRQAEDLLRHADRALYAAKSKSQGKNCCAVYRPELDSLGSTPSDPSRTQAIQRDLVRVDAPATAWLHSNLRSPLPLQRGTLSLGRGGTCDLVIPHPQVSRLHGRIRVDGGGVEYEDLGSRNGSSYDGEPVTAPVNIRPGHILTIGPYTFEIRAEGAREEDTVQLDAESLADSLREGSAP